MEDVPKSQSHGNKHDAKHQGRHRHEGNHMTTMKKKKQKKKKAARARPKNKQGLKTGGRGYWGVGILGGQKGETVSLNRQKYGRRSPNEGTKPSKGGGAWGQSYGNRHQTHKELIPPDTKRFL